MKDFQKPVLFLEACMITLFFPFKPLLIINKFIIITVSKVMKVTLTITKDICD